MNNAQVDKFDEKTKQFEWTTMLALQFFLLLIAAVASFLTAKNLTSIQTTLTQELLISIIPNLILGILFIFFGYYFTKTFFKNTSLTVIEFYTLMVYLSLPILAIYALISSLALALSYVSPALASFSYILFLPLIYLNVRNH